MDSTYDWQYAPTFDIFDNFFLEIMISIFADSNFFECWKSNFICAIINP